MEILLQENAVDREMALLKELKELQTQEEHLVEIKEHNNTASDNMQADCPECGAIEVYCYCDRFEVCSTET